LRAAIAFIYEALNRDYSLSINIYNFDPNNVWVVDGWASNNGDVSGGAFTNAVMPALTSQS
jgi:hypothetical protein